MFVTRLVLYAGVVLAAFLAGAGADRLLKSPSHPGTVIAVRTHPQPWLLSKQLVSRSLQTRSFRTDKLRTNSNDEIVWRWLKDSIANFPQNWVKLEITDREVYSVVLYPLAVPEPTELAYYNLELDKKGLPRLEEGKRYQPITVYQGDIICPSWDGLIDVEEAKLVYFAGSSA